MPKLVRTDPFKEYFNELSKAEQKQAAKALRFLAENPKHPSLEVHKMRGTPYWEAYVNESIRIIYEHNGDTFILHAIGHHDILRKY
jgi:mRNA-degrading endonuclease YafQ of YafQ-DinJ toxin-antitoxin module